MTNPFSFQNGGVVQGPGTGGAIAQGLAGVLSQIQQQRENQFRMQELQRQQQAQAAQEQYYQQQVAIQQQAETRLGAEQQAQIGARRQVGGAMRAAMTPPTQLTPNPTPSSAVTQLPGPGIPTMGIFGEVLQGGAKAVSPYVGVSDENLPAAVDAVRSLQPKPDELPTSGKEFQFMQHLSQVDPSGGAAKFFYDNWVKKQPGVVVNTGDKVENAFGVEMAKSDVAAQGEATKAATQAASSFPSMVEAYGLIDRSLTGFGSKQVLALARAAGAVGFKPGKDIAADTQTLSKLLRDGVIAQLQTRALGSGTAVSDADRNYMEQIQGADLTQEPGAIKRIIRINVGLGIEKMVTAKMLLEQQMQDHPESAGVLKGKISLIEKQMAPIWNQYKKMLAKETEQAAEAQMKAGPEGDKFFPARQ